MYLNTCIYVYISYRAKQHTSTIILTIYICVFVCVTVCYKQGEKAHFNDDSYDEPNRSFEKVMASFCLVFFVRFCLWLCL